jgi:hypothetical protein
MSNTVDIFLNVGPTKFTENVEGYRILAFTYQSKHSGDDAADEAFIMSNAPSLLLPDETYELKKEYYKSPKRPITIGDAVVVNDDIYLCIEDGWKKLDL